MKSIELWEKFIKENNIADCEYEEWSFGSNSDQLANLVIKGEKNATSSLCNLYELEKEPLPQIGEYSVILDSSGNAMCVIKTTNVEIIPFNEITETHAYKEGEGDKSLKYWKEVHKEFFSKCLNEVGLKFNVDIMVVFEEFEVVYKS